MNLLKLFIALATDNNAAWRSVVDEFAQNRRRHHDGGHHREKLSARFGTKARSSNSSCNVSPRIAGV
jgi:hypothetical protein